LISLLGVAWIFIFGGTCARDPLGPILQVHNAAEFAAAVDAAVAGTRIELSPGQYGGGYLFSNLHGEADKPIVITAADPQQPPTFTGSNECLHLIDPRYVELRYLDLSAASANGLNIDDGGSFESPAHNVVLRGLTIKDIGSTGNHDGIKLSGLTDFRIEDCVIERWGDSGSGIDLVGCHRGQIAGCIFRFSDTQGGSGIQAKGGSTNLRIHHNRFEHSGQRAINIGGNTGLQFFRPRPEDFEAKDVLVEHNVFIGSNAADAPQRSAPDLPTPDIDSTVGQDPRFADADAGDFHLLSGSPAKDTGAFASKSPSKN